MAQNVLLLAQAQTEFRQDLREGVEADAELHDEAHGGAFPPFESTFFVSQLIWLAITFGLLYFLLSRFVIPRISSVLEVRGDRIKSDLAEAQRLRSETDAAIASHEAALAAARASSQKIASETRAKVDADAAVQRKAVEADLAERLAAAERQIAASKAEAMLNVRTIAISATAAIVAQLSGQEPSASEVEPAVDASLKG
ncbi:F0F1 ATP synthase subunit B' [Terrihabitans rhizophilus]|jgi:F-type H+-transporting ATPase subunit b|uniref:ATP synthase subunit b n=1 Tax=Terrihabitans rhizophilus TaxID=3092662 RepID=A0ABU4RR67_9HYPH|nr:F0F1 ATP synthase subunit B' [Terrihabitans sp. PJ23]MDX6807338.1 F0F1 ATP synthase subunit B' [Terrihabitans sp. PJ23]